MVSKQIEKQSSWAMGKCSQIGWHMGQVEEKRKNVILLRVVKRKYH